MEDINTVQTHPGNGLDYQRHSTPEAPPLAQVPERQEQFARNSGPLEKTLRLRADIRKTIDQLQGKPQEVEEHDAPTEPDDEATPEQAQTTAPDKPSNVSEAVQPTEKSPINEPPTAWTKEAKAEWANLPEKAKAAIIKREQDVEKGIQSLKSQYQSIDQIKSKYEPALRRVNIQFNDLIDGAGGWFVALSGPQRMQAAANLLRQFGIDPATLAGPPQQDQSGTQGQLPPQLVQYVQNMAQRLDSYEQQTAAQMHTAATNFVENWAKDKPFYKAVRGEMGRLLSSGEIPLLSTGHPDLDAAYVKAIEPILEQQAQAEARRLEEQRLQRAQKRAAAASISSRASPGGANVRVNAQQKGKSVRESLVDAMNELRTS